MPESAVVLFFDTVTLSNFALAGAMDLLVVRYGSRAHITPEVLDEVADGVVAGYDALLQIEDAVAAGSLGNAPSLTSAERGIYRSLLRVLAPGEASCIACAKARGGTVVTDDRMARARCAELGVSCTGTIGILKASVSAGELPPAAADAILDRMIAAGYRSPVSRISDIM